MKILLIKSVYFDKKDGYKYLSYLTLNSNSRFMKISFLINLMKINKHKTLAASKNNSCQNATVQ